MGRINTLSLIRTTREILWQKANGIITAETALDQIDRAIREYNGESEQLVMELNLTEKGAA